ncbi:hypothetical protein PROFUN_06506 [Planoprotostelium fungivorum]|uniref:CST complex subunit STN1 n=1 Tax=Planoprotostelium fungivorum TaxID=1890364 RepID=A0A2P6NNZ3_9EUKA|nr:hypothetical protein PROFUN_06506 [Planoprotostelium fungivorum]
MALLLACNDLGDGIKHFQYKVDLENMIGNRCNNYLPDGPHLRCFLSSLREQQQLVHIVGYIIAKTRLIRRRTLYLVDDGTAVFHCIFHHDWVDGNEYPYTQPTRPTELAEPAWSSVFGVKSDPDVDVGHLVTLRGKTSFFKGKLEIILSIIVKEEDLNAELHHWAQIIYQSRTNGN